MSDWQVAVVAGSAADVVTAAAVVVGLALWLTTRAWSPAVPVFLELMLAAGLLRLSAGDSWTAIAGAAVIVAVRVVIRTSEAHAVAVTGGGGGHRG